MDDTEPTAAGEGGPEADAPRVGGVPIPPGLLVPHEWLPGLLVRLNTAEVAWFANVSAAEAVEICRRATGVEPRRRVVLDRYFDTPDRRLLRGSVSVRLRQYVHPPREIAYEIIAVGWGGVTAGGRRGVNGLVQTFERNDASGIPPLLDRYAAAGFVEVARVHKVRFNFEVVVARSVDEHGLELRAPERTGVAGARGSLRVVDFGIKVDVDELLEPLFPEPCIIEVECDPAREAECAGLVRDIAAALGPRAREKAHNKIVYLMGGA